jgi:hypothetical protein
MTIPRHTAYCVAIVATVAVGATSCARVAARSYEQSYWAAEYKWSFREHFPQADRLFNGFDYGHAILYQTLVTRSDAARRLESGEFDFITTSVLRHPPNVPLEEAAIGPDYVRLVPEVARCSTGRTRFTDSSTTSGAAMV